MDGGGNLVTVGDCRALKEYSLSLDVASIPAVWYWQLTGVRVGNNLLDRSLNLYDNAVREWHQLAQQAAPKRYRTDHRGRGGYTVYSLQEPLEKTTAHEAASSSHAPSAPPDEERGGEESEGEESGGEE